MPLLELTCLGIILSYLALALLRANPSLYLRRYLFLSVASFIAEDSCIRLYGFYRYDPGWSFFLDRTPIVIVLIWPIVILSAWELARHLVREDHPLIPLAGGAVVLADASFIEPIAVQAKLWAWTQPGFFGVPPIGVLGWAYFAAVCISIFRLVDRRAWSRLSEIGILLIAPFITHLLLLATWWGAARWVNLPIPSWGMVGLVWLLGVGLVVLARRTAIRRRIPPVVLLSRIPAALFFFVLLLLHGRDERALFAFCLAFAPPYVSLIDWRQRRDGTRGGTKEG